MSLNLLSFSLLSFVQASNGQDALFPELSNIFNWAIGIGAILALMSVIYSGIMYTVSAGNESLKKQAIERIKAAILGMAFLMGAYILLRTIDPNILSPKSEVLQFPELQEQQPPAATSIQVQDNYGLSERQREELEGVLGIFYGSGLVGVIVEEETGNIYPVDIMGNKAPIPIQCDLSLPYSDLPSGSCSP